MSTPNLVLDMKTSCPPLPIRYRQLTGKFILKCPSLSVSSIINVFNSVNTKWRFVYRFTTLISVMILLLLVVLIHVYKVHKLPLYDIPYDALTLSPFVTIVPNFLGHTLTELRSNTSMYNQQFIQAILTRIPRSSRVDLSRHQGRVTFIFFLNRMYNQLPICLNTFLPSLLGDFRSSVLHQLFTLR